MDFSNNNFIKPFNFNQDGFLNDIQNNNLYCQKCSSYRIHIETGESFTAYVCENCGEKQFMLFMNNPELEEFLYQQYDNREDMLALENEQIDIEEVEDVIDKVNPQK